MNHTVAHVGLRVVDPDAYIDHVAAVLGLEEVGRDEDSIRLALPDGQPCVVLIPAGAASCDHFALRTSAENLAEIRTRARTGGFDLAAPHYLDGEGLRLLSPHGVAVEVGVGGPVKPNEVDRDAVPTIRWLDHLSFSADKLEASVQFYRDVLGFRLSESVADQRHWLRCGPNHHTIALFRGGDSLQHYAFETRDLLQIERLGDLLAARGQNFVWGPGRHGLGENIFTYHVDPCGAVLEVCAEMFQVLEEEEWVAPVWPANQTGSAVRWGPMPPPGFLSLGIPSAVSSERS